MSGGSLEEREPGGPPAAAAADDIEGADESEAPSAPERSLGAGTMTPSSDIAAVQSESVLPGGHRGGFQRLPTGPLAITSESAPADPDGEQPSPVYLWAPSAPTAPSRVLAGWALGFSVVGLVVSLFVGWGFPLGIAGIVAAILALRRPLESRVMAVWALVLGAVSILYSSGWLLVAAVRANFFG